MAIAPRNCPSVLTDSTPTSSPTPRIPTASPTPCRRSICSLRSRKGANRATKSGTEAMSTAVSPDGTSCSPTVMRRNGAAIATAPRPSAVHGRRRASCSASHVALPWSRIARSSTPAPSSDRPHTIKGAEKPSRQYLMSRYEPPQMAARRPNSPTWRGVTTR